MPIAVSGSNIVFADGSSIASGFTGFKNRIINGAMVIDQRNAGASITPTSDAGYSLDRWKCRLSVSSKYSVQQNAGSVTPPAGFSNYLGVTSLSAYTPSGSDFFSINQQVEGNNWNDLAWGTANAKTITLSFWVRSSLTGTFGGSFSSGVDFNYSYPFTYTISSANTWEYKSVTIVGPTTGNWTATTGAGIEMWFTLGVGTTYAGTANTWQSGGKIGPSGCVNVVATNGATFYITGVQLEVGSTATSFDYRPYGFEFDLCRRYCEVFRNDAASPQESNIPQGIAQVDGANRPEIMIYYYPKRTGPTITVLNSNLQWNSMNNTAVACSYLATYVGTFTYGANMFFSSSSGVTPGSLSGIGMILMTNVNKVTVEAEL